MNAIRLHREISGLTQEGVANALGITQGAVSQWERGETMPRAAILVALSKLYNCTVDDLLRVPMESENIEDGSIQ